MRSKIKTIFLLNIILFFISFSSIVNATILAKGDSTSTTVETFSGEVKTKVFDRATGTIYLGVDASTDTSYRISKTTRLLGNQKPIFTGLYAASNYPEFLALATETGDTSPYIAYVEYSDTQTAQTSVNIIKNDGSSPQSISSVKDANAQTTAGITGLAANKSFIFAAVEPYGGEFGEQYSGIAVIKINQTTLALTQAAAEAGDTTVKAKKFDYETEQIRIQHDVNYPFSTVNLYWDDPLQRLYICSSLTTGTYLNDGAKAVVVARVDSNGVMTLSNIAPDAAFNANRDNIVGVKNPTAGSNAEISIKHVRVMHCSTGPSYLIVNGGVGDVNSINHKIFALPLVDNSSDATYHGTLAAKASTLSSNKFITPATINSQLPLSGEPAVDVGTGTLPTQADLPIADLVVVDDTVYVAMNINPTSTSDSGVLYSQALFDETGKIIRWTPWTKRALPYDAFPGTTGSKGRVAFFDVDACTGKLWAVEGSQKKAVCSTTWDLGGTNSLPNKLHEIFNKNLCNKGSFSVLDLDQSTRGFTDDMYATTTCRYALFGGADKVVFARISEAYDYSSTNTPQVVIEDFSSANNFLYTGLGECAGCVHVLEYSRGTPDEGPTNYFFAGTEQGLFAFADVNGNGFNVNQLGLLSTAPFLDGRWHKIGALPGSVIDIKTTGERLYVLMMETSCPIPLKCKLYGINYATSLSSMFNNISMLAESSVGIFSREHMFVGMEIVSTGSTGNPSCKEQIVLATSHGLFNSDADQITGNGITSATNQTQANWQRLPSTNTKPYAGITAPDAITPSTVWPFSIQDRSGYNTYERSSIEQISGKGNTACTQAQFNDFVPLPFNAVSTAISFQSLDPISHFWSDGARRFFIINCKNDPYYLNKLMCFPYNTTEWNVGNPGLNILFDQLLQVTKRFYWVHQIGFSGILMAGTDIGIVALE